MEGHNEFYHNNIKIHGAFHGAKLPAYKSPQQIRDAKEELSFIIAQEKKEGKCNKKLLKYLKGLANDNSR